MANNRLYIVDRNTQEEDGTIEGFGLFKGMGGDWYRNTLRPDLEESLMEWLCLRDYNCTSGNTETSLELVDENQIVREGLKLIIDYGR